ncbi:MAG: patatin-like phospholipase family protein [Panacagrimonas sp.]
MEVSRLLAKTGLFASLAPLTLEQLADRTRTRLFRSGDTVIKPGADADHLFIVAIGRLRVVAGDGTLINDIGRLEPVGEISLLSGEKRTTTVYAVRDSVLLEITRADLFTVFERNPTALLALTRTVIARFRHGQRASLLAAARHARCFAVVAAHDGLDPGAFAKAFETALRLEGKNVQRIDAASVDQALGPSMSNTPFGQVRPEARLIDYLHQQEMDFDHLIYVASAAPGPWTRRCMRQADRVLMLADASAAPADSPQLLDLKNHPVRARLDVVLLRDQTEAPVDSLGWRNRIGASDHFFLRPQQDDDIRGIARSLTGQALGLVLGGGGARGFAHIGLIRALEESGIAVDVVGGTSMGAFIGALLASGHDSTQILEITRQTFVERNLLNDFLFPRVSLIRGRKVRLRLEEIFGERLIEELHTPYFCVSTNLSRGRAMVHRSGRLSTWVGTSMSVPGVAPPVVYQGDLLVDGAVVNSLPTDVMQSLERGPIIASDVSTEGTVAAPGIDGPDPEGLLNWDAEDKRPSLLSILFRTATLTSESGVERRAARADLYLRMPVAEAGMFDWKKLDEIVERGYQHAMERLPGFKSQVLNKA